jgi:adenine-specific DNA-methyltransferase
MSQTRIINGFRKFLAKINKEGIQNISPLDICISILSDELQIQDFIGTTDIETKYYWIGNIYASLIPSSSRKELAAFFTPPLIARYTINRLEEFGFNITSSRILDPASGGAAVLTPLATALIKKLKLQGKTHLEIGTHIFNHFSGIEIDKDLANLSGLILNDFISKQLPPFKKDLSRIIHDEDSLYVSGCDNYYHAVVSNPPYGKMRNPPIAIYKRFADSLTDKHVNKYALFIRLAIDWAMAGGFIALVVPTSFIAGPSFGNLRKSILENTHVLAIDLIDTRDGLFVDVLQDACILFLRKKKGKEPETPPTCRLLDEFGSYRELGSIDTPSELSDRPWVLPSELSPEISTNDFFSEAYSRLADYGYGVRAGYFVWNRQQERGREGNSPRRNEYPLIWAHCIKPNEPCLLSTHRNHVKPGLICFVRFDSPSESLINQPVIVLQRTTNRHQARRLVAGYITKDMIRKYSSVITENHTIIVYPLRNIKQKINLRMMCRLLNSKPVDMRYRQISGTVSVSVKLLKEMPLPHPALIMNRYGKDLSAEEFDELVENCYLEAARLKR